MSALIPSSSSSARTRSGSPSSLIRRSVTISTRLSPSRRASYAISSVAPSPNLIGDASITNTVSVGRVTPFMASSLYSCASVGSSPDYNRAGESIAAPRPWAPAGHEVRGASAPRLPSLLRAGAPQRDRRQHRARHQLLGHLSGVPLADARGVRRHQPLGALPALLGVRGRPGRSLRLP